MSRSFRHNFRTQIILIGMESIKHAINNLIICSFLATRFLDEQGRAGISLNFFFSLVSESVLVVHVRQIGDSVIYRKKLINYIQVHQFGLKITDLIKGDVCELE